MQLRTLDLHELEGADGVEELEVQQVLQVGLFRSRAELVVVAVSSRYVWRLQVRLVTGDKVDLIEFRLHTDFMAEI